MEIYKTSPYNDGVDCSKCDQPIDVQDGFYHCEVDDEDYHLGCLTDDITLS